MLVDAWMYSLKWFSVTISFQCFKIQSFLHARETDQPTTGSWTRAEIACHHTMLRSLPTFSRTWVQFMCSRTCIWTKNTLKMSRLCFVRSMCWAVMSVVMTQHKKQCTDANTNARYAEKTVAWFLWPRSRHRCNTGRAVPQYVCGTENRQVVKCTSTTPD